MLFGNMKFTFFLTGLSAVAAQSSILSDAGSRSSPLSSSSSLSWGSTRNASSSVSPTSSGSRSTTGDPSVSSPRGVSTTVSTSLNVTGSVSPSPKPTAYVNPWAGNFSSLISQHGTGSAYALQCQNLWFSYTSINSDFPQVSDKSVLTTETIRSTTVYEVHTYYETQYYTLCDGHPRVITSTPTATLTTTWDPKTTTYPVNRIGWKEYPNPNCTVNWDDCEGLWSQYESASSVYSQISFEKANTIVSLGPGAKYWVVNGVTTTFPAPSPAKISLSTEQIIKYRFSGQYLIITTPPPGGFACACGKTMTAGGPPVTIENTIDFTQTPYTPSCRTEKPTCTANQKCKIKGDEVEVFWFPPQANATRNMCATDPPGPIITRPPTNCLLIAEFLVTWTPVSTGPYAVLPGNTTWFSGNVYVSFKNIHGQCNWSGTSVEVGSTYHGSVLTMAPSELYSMRGTLGTWGEQTDVVVFNDNAYSFNFADLVSPIPWSAWAGMDRCVAKKCTTMSGNYNPRIAVPEAIRRMDPRWASCDLDLGGLYDPPIALQTAGNMFATTTTAGNVGPQPTPGQSPPQQGEATNKPIVPGVPPSWPTDTPSPPSIPSIPGNQGGNPGNPKPVPAPNPAPGQNPSPGQNNPSPGQSNPSPDQNNPSPSQNNPSPGQNNPSPGQNNPSPGQNNPSPGQNNPSPGQVPSPGQIPAPGPIPLPPQPLPTTIGTIASNPIVINPSVPTLVTIGTTTLTPGAPALTLDSSTISMPDAFHIVVSGPGQAAPSTINVPRPDAPAPTAGAIITLPGGQSVTATAVLGQGQNGRETSVAIDGTMISIGGAGVTMANGLIVSVAPNGNGVVVIGPNGATNTVGFSSMEGIAAGATAAAVAAAIAAAITPAPTALVTVGGRVYTATLSGGSVVVPEIGVTVGIGSSTVVGGTTVRGLDGGVAVGSSTVRFSGGGSGSVTRTTSGSVESSSSSSSSSSSTERTTGESSLGTVAKATGSAKTTEKGDAMRIGWRWWMGVVVFGGIALAV